jgi:hypothetical protein
MKAVPWDVFEPLVGFDILSIARVDISAGIVLITIVVSRCRFAASGRTSVAFGAESAIFIRDELLDEILTFLADDGLLGKSKNLLMFEDVHFRLLPASFFGKKWRVTVKTLQHPSVDVCFTFQ